MPAPEVSSYVAGCGEPGRYDRADGKGASDEQVAPPRSAPHCGDGSRHVGVVDSRRVRADCRCGAVELPRRDAVDRLHTERLEQVHLLCQRVPLSLSRVFGRGRVAGEVDHTAHRAECRRRVLRAHLHRGVRRLVGHVPDEGADARRAATGDADPDERRLLRSQQPQQRRDQADGRVRSAVHVRWVRHVPCGEFGHQRAPPLLVPGDGNAAHERHGS